MIFPFILCGAATFWGYRLYFYREGRQWLFMGTIVACTVITLDFRPSWGFGGLLWLGFIFSLALPLAMVFSPFRFFTGPATLARRLEWSSRNMVIKALKEAWPHGWDIYIDDYTQEIYAAPVPRSRLYTERILLADTPPGELDNNEASWLAHDIWAEHFEYFREGN